MKNTENSVMAVLIVMLIMSIVLPMANAQIESNKPTTNEVNITGPHVVFFNVSGLKPLDNRQRFILQGNKTSTGCQYPDIMLKKTKDEVNISKVIRELAVNPDTCQQLVEQGTLNEPPENSSPQYKKIFQNAAQLSSQGTKQARMTTNWYDPINITVNYVYAQINFNYDGIYAYPNWAGFGHDWYTPTYWYDVSYSTESYNQSSPLFIYARIYDHMRNDWFLFTTTNVYYQPNTVIGYPDGSVAGSSNTWAEGSIAWMLHYEKILS